MIIRESMNRGMADGPKRKGMAECAGNRNVGILLIMPQHSLRITHYNVK
jgi:hypothetical protein